MRLAAVLLGCACALAACEKVTEDQDRASATLAWTAPTMDTSGQPLGPLAGYKVYYGTSAQAMTRVIVLSGSRPINYYTVTGLAAGTWYFAVAARSGAGTEGRLSNVVHKDIH